MVEKFYTYKRLHLRFAIHPLLRQEMAQERRRMTEVRCTCAGVFACIAGRSKRKRKNDHLGTGFGIQLAGFLALGDRFAEQHCRDAVGQPGAFTAGCS